MIGSDEMSSTSMDISETFRPEDLSKTDFFDFVTAPDMGIGIGVGDRPPGTTETNGQGDQPLQGYDQFWSSDKDPNRLESTIFEDLDRYCWQQQQQHQQQSQSHHSSATVNPSNTAGAVNQQTSVVGNTDGQIYTLTVLNGNEPWLKRDPDAPIAPTLDLDSLLGNFPGYIKSEYVYDDSGGYNTASSAKDDLNQQQGQNPGVIPVTTVVTTNSTNLAQFQNNNNDWHIADNNSTEQSSAESLLRSALQGKGYSKGLHLQNGIALIPTPNVVKDEELRRALFPTDQDSLSFADSTLSTPMFDDTQNIVHSPTSHQQSQTAQATSNSATTSSSSCTSSNNTSHSTTAGIIVDDMFLSLETAFTDEFEKIKRIASEVQQFCTSSDYPEVIMEVTTAMPQPSQQPLQVQPPPQPPPPPQPLQPEVTTSNPMPTSTITKTTAKKYKRSSLSSNNNNNNNNNNLPNNNTSPTHCNGQRKERSLHYCSICSKGFKDKYSVNVHIRTHTGEKPFACSLCGKSFRQKAHLAKHYQTHLAQKSNNVVKSGKQSSSSRPQSQSAAPQRQVSPNTSGPSLPPANGLLANR